MAQTAEPQGISPMLPEQPDLSGGYYPAEDITGGLPINLDSLRDGPPGSKPFYPYSTLIRYAIKGSPNQKLLLEDIYYAIESRFPYFRTAPSGWKNSVRHNLSLNPCFEKVPRPLTDRGKGSYWTVNDNVDPRTGVHRIRKKKGKGTRNTRGATEEAETEQYQPPPENFEEHVQYPPPPMPDNGETSRTPAPAQYPPFDPSFAAILPGMRFPIAGPILLPDEQFDLDANGNVDWHSAWLKEIDHLRALTEEHEKAGAETEWYRMMLFRVRGALLPAPPMNPEGFPPPPPHMAPPPAPHTSSEIQQSAVSPIPPIQSVQPAQTVQSSSPVPST
ncbi:hypothetical protein FISHEDRAFT_48353 [Fistulina hepatica ATCC 64428]|uniref:Fork-head domain-containing protein n=1 Tax=Fistulina hepatica ATCC 64428 TaxID=1128425 RepID=A0A0D7A7L2_9AGAR|nr:hypothetical protein FISHEDRAFT_48353 [Fistulina hepatica ATCC 64428]